MNEVKDINYMKQLANKLMFDITDQEAEEMVQEFKMLDRQLALLNDVDTTDVEPMIFPFEVQVTSLREDIVNDTLTQEEVLANAPKVNNGHFELPKVVK